MDKVDMEVYLKISSGHIEGDYKIVESSRISARG